MPNSAHDVVIIGGGIAGLFCALQLAPRPVTILTGPRLGEGSSSAWAQGGLAAAVAAGDTPQAHVRDTVAAGAGIVDEALANDMCREAAARISDLIAYGVPFDKEIDGSLAVGREAAHSARRIVHVKGDLAGKAIVAALVEAVRRTPAIRVHEGLTAEDLVADDGRITAVLVRSSSGRTVIPTRAVVLATGGIGHLYSVTTNPSEAIGSGLAMAARAGAVLADTEFVQFHPTAIAVGQDPAPLASEALRGEGATLVNRAGKRFMEALHRATWWRAVFSPKSRPAAAHFLIRVPQSAELFPTGSRRSTEAASLPASILFEISSRLLPRLTITWGASTPTRKVAPPSTACGRSA